MRTYLVLVPLSLLATPAFAQVGASPMPQIADPRTIDQMSQAAEAVSQALLHVPLGEVRAAINGREPTPEDRSETLGREAGVSDREVRAQIEAAKPMIAHGAQAMARALPQIMRSLADVQNSVDRAMANLPDPNYPRR